MCRTRGWTGLRPLIFAFGLVAATTAGAQAASMSASVPASPLLAYNTVGSSIDSSGVSASQVISFIPATGAVITPTNLSFGKFVVAPTSGTTTYTNTPFTIQLKVDSVNSTTPVTPNQTPITISGVLNGTVSNANQTNVVATFNPLANTDFQTGLYVNTLGLPNSPLNLVPSSVNNGETSLQAAMTTVTAVTQPVPEPSTIALFAATIVGLGFRRRMLARRAA